LHWGLYYQTLDWQSLFRREWPMQIENGQNLPNERAALYSADFSFDLGKKIQLAAGVYFRSMASLLVPIDESEGTILEFRENPTGASHSSQLMANRPRVTRGRQTGVELALSKSTPAWHLNFSYTHARSLMRNLDNTTWIAAATDRPHDWAGDLSCNLGSHVQLSSFLRYSTGNPYTPIIAILKDLNHWRWPSSYRFIHAPRNSRRHPDYFRIDLRATLSGAVLGTSYQFYLEWLNVANHRNVYQILWSQTRSRDENEFEQSAPADIQQNRIIMLPRLVVGGITVRF
ncbi:MAG: hypothetical protein ACREOI_37155, partial [bacterium]